MNFTVGDNVIYKDLAGVISFVSPQYISILVSEGDLKYQNVDVVVYAVSYKDVYYQDEK